MKFMSSIDFDGFMMMMTSLVVVVVVDVVMEVVYTGNVDIKVRLQFLGVCMIDDNIDNQCHHHVTTLIPCMSTNLFTKFV
jgi:hypothetical protein